VGPALRAKVDASDVIQETLWKAYRGFPEFRGTTEGELLAWLRRVLARTIADHVRRYAKTARRDVAREESIEDALDRSSEALRALAADQTSPSAAAARREDGVALADALATLRPEHREVILLRNLEGLDWPQVAERMGRTPDAARMLWGRALASMRPLVKGRG
jgi:RNA polymerase sigma-70 factor (ECF subfamily)